MLKLVLHSWQIRFAYSANHLIHFLRRLPIVKKLIPDALYGNYDLKKVFILFSFFLMAVQKIIFRLFYILFIIGIGIFIWCAASHGGYDYFFIVDNPFLDLKAKAVIPYILWIWLIFTLLGSFTFNRICSSLNYNHDDLMINYLRTDPARYAKLRIITDILIDIILYLPIFMIIFAIADISLLYTFVILLVLITLRMCGISLNLWMYKHTKKATFNSFISIIIYISGLLAVALIPIWLELPNWSTVFSNAWLIIGLISVTGATGFYILHYKLYYTFIRKTIATYAEIMITIDKKSKARKGINLQRVKDWNKGITQEDLQLDKYEKKKGFAYLNAIFFERHRKFFNKNLYIKALSILLVGIVASLIFLGITWYRGKSPAQLNNITYASLFRYSPLFFFIIYIISMGRVITASIFSNCDIEMLHYPYYRTKETIYAAFKSRFIFILRSNFQITTALFVATIISIACLFGSTDLGYTSMFFILITCIGIFFAFNDLFLYYIIQPYDTDGKNKSITYKLIDVIIYIIAYFNLNLKLDFWVYSALMIIITILYLIIGILLLLRFAPKNFKLR